MKKICIFRLLKIFICFLFITSCEKNLEPKFYNRLGLNDFPSTAQEVSAAVTGVYGTTLAFYASIGFGGPFVNEEATTDEFYSANRNSTWLRYANLTYSSTQNLVTEVYAPMVKGVTKCVNLISEIDKVEMDQALKTRFKAELHGITALISYTLYNNYGPTAIVVDPSITSNPNSNFKPTRPTKEWMVNFIKEEGRKAADNLPISYSASDYGRMTKGAALMVLLKLAMHDKNWIEADNISDEIMNLKYYQLQASYNSVFTVENEMNKEIILAIPRSVSSGANTWMRTIIPRGYYLPDGKEWVGAAGYYRVDWKIYDKFLKDDDRLKNLWGTLNTKDGVIDLRTNTTSILYYGGAVPYKYPLDPNGEGTSMGNDIVKFRYADVLLLRAEALNNIKGPNQESIDLINMIRSRAKTSLVELSQFASKQSLNDFILDERARELFFEGTRRQDLIRHGKFLSAAKERGAIIALGDYLLVYPIPQDAIDANHKIVQNEGY